MDNYFKHLKSTLDDMQEDMTAFRLANIGNVHLLDGPVSDAAKSWLVGIWEDLLEQFEYTISDEIQISNMDDTDHETSDRLIPIYTHHIWEIFYGATLWDEDLDDYGTDGGGLEDLAKLAIYSAGRRLVSELLSEIEQSVQDLLGRDEEVEEIIDLLASPNEI